MAFNWFGLIEAGTDLIDDLHTSDEEKEEARRKWQAMVEGFEVEFEKEITARHASDMKSDSWLSKNIRPLSLAVTMATIYLLVYLTTFTTLTELQVRVLEGWVPMLVGLLGVMVTFYFGSRGFEKIAKMRGE